MKPDFRIRVLAQTAIHFVLNILLSLVVFVVYVVFIECIVLDIPVVLVVLRLLDESLPGSH